MKLEVLSLGGSLIFRDNKVNYDYIKKLKSLLMSYKDRKFAVVVGGGFVARLYINALEHFGAKQDFLSHFGVAITRTNARMLANAFGKCSNTGLFPKSMKDVKNLLGRHDIIFCGGLRYEANQTSDGTAAQIAGHFKTRFINMTDVDGLYDKDPKRNKDARFIKQISHVDFDKIIKKMKYHPGQHFVLDQHASDEIKKNKITTFIISGDLNNLKNVLDGKKFIGTIIN